MSTESLLKRVQRIEHCTHPEEHDGLFTWEEFAALCELWKQDPQEFGRRAARSDGAVYRAFERRCELNK